MTTVKTVRKDKNAKIWEKEEFYEKERAKHRKENGRITYDCFNAQTTGDRVTCKKGKILHSESPDGSIKLLSVLRGRTSSVCKQCRWFDPDPDTETN